MTYRGRVKNGAIVLEAGAELPEGARVRIEIELTDPAARPAGDMDPLFLMTGLAGDTGLPDLATNVDHYLYGHPKQGDAE